jgi:hypothetical protein
MRFATAAAFGNVLGKGTLAPKSEEGARLEHSGMSYHLQ